mmetsp:Transcript_8617/g.27096  ORF Transcript_8617/g.27096 Transcript_8617/m.27096 type:complete len:87 (+) Transcript_8617:1089-1349(+)
MWMIWLHTPFKKSCECDTTIRQRLNSFFRYSSSHTHDSRSRWLVGSSSSRMLGLTNNARASATRMRQPPDMSLVARFIITLSKPRP